MKVVALAGGVGGARLVDGLDQVLAADELTVVVNTGDDFEHWGLHISPDLDTVMYTLAGLAPEERGWGIDGDSFETLSSMKRYGAPSWFELGDKDLATHLWRTRALRNKHSLTDVTSRLCKQLDVKRPILPMSDEWRPTMVHTKDERTIAFQHWLVEERAKPRLARITFRGAPIPTGQVLAALQEADLVIVCPSNPYVSIDPILALNGIREALASMPCVGISPIVAGRAIKGPLASMIEDLAGKRPSAEAVVAHYGGLLNGFVVQVNDGEGIEIPTLETDIIMRSREDRSRLAKTVLDFASRTR